MSYDKLMSSQSHFGLPPNKWGFVDRTGGTMTEVNEETDVPHLTIRDNLIYFDTRDCLGELSLKEAQLAFSFNSAIIGSISPEEFKKTLNSNGIIIPDKLVDVVDKLDISGVITGFPRHNIGDPWVEGNKVMFRLPNKIKLIKSFEIVNAIIPRDIIPLYVYFPGFINNCLPIVFRDSGLEYLNPSIGQVSSTWQSPIPETADDFFDKTDGISKNKLGGVYWTPLRYWRSYTGPNCMSNPSTPPPYNLWNPPQDPDIDDPWPFQPRPIKGQRIPTYRAKNGVVFSGYGLYDLDDFPEFQELQTADGTTIQIPVRKLILKLLVPEGQYLNGMSAQELIDNSVTSDFNDQGIVDNPYEQTGYGDYQRFIPGPGLGMRYQPNQWRKSKSAPIDLSVSTYDPESGYIGPMPVPFPTFRGNVWGPYGRPGDRFQNVGLQSTVDELYLNGDLSNLEGNPVIWEDFDPTVESYTFEYYLITLKRINTVVRFSNFETAANPNIKNAMRVKFDGGYGSTSVYVGDTLTGNRGSAGPIITSGLPNTQYDGVVHRVNPDVWVTPASSSPSNWIDTLPGPQKPSIVEDQASNFGGWMYLWRDIYPWMGKIYVPVTGGGTGPMEYFDGGVDGWKKSEQTGLLTTGSSQWSCSPVVGKSNSYCLPVPNVSTSELVSNVGWGGVSGLSLTTGGVDYEVGSGYFLETYDGDQIGDYAIDVNTVTSDGAITSFTRTFGSLSFSAVLNVLAPTFLAGKHAAILSTPPNVLTLHAGGSNYEITTGTDVVSTRAQTGTGTGLTMRITSVYGISTTVSGVIDGYEIVSRGSGYMVGDYVLLLQDGSDNNALFVVTDAIAITEDIIPEYNTYHYMDPLAVGPASGGTLPVISQNYVNGAGVCTSDCPDNCTPLGGEYEACVGEIIADASTACNDPRPIPNQPCMLKCDFVAQQSPDEEWAGDVSSNYPTCRPNDDNVRNRQRNSYVDRRVAYNDLGAGNGLFITSLLNYRSLFVSSTPDTDIVIHIKQAKRSSLTQSLNPQVNFSNFFIPIRLNLGSTSGTLEYVEAVQGTLTSSGVYWKKMYYPPLAELSDLEMEFFTYDGTPIPLERTLGFNRQIEDQLILLSSSITSSFILHGSFSSYSPNLPPFATTNKESPSSGLISGASNSKSLSDPFNPKLSQYLQRNLSLSFKVQHYQAENPGITHIIKKMPDSYIQQQQSEGFNDVPVASNLGNYDDDVSDGDYNYYDDNIEY